MIIDNTRASLLSRTVYETIFLRTRFRAPHLCVVLIYFDLFYDFLVHGEGGAVGSVFFSGIHSFASRFMNLELALLSCLVTSLLSRTAFVIIDTTGASLLSTTAWWLDCLRDHRQYAGEFAK